MPAMSPRSQLPIFVLIAVFGLLIVGDACRAHKLVLFASAEGRKITGWAYFAGGGKLKDITIKVLGPGGEHLGQTTTDAEGSFEFVAEKRCDHTFVLETDAGHRAEYTVKAEELPADLPSPTPDPQKSGGGQDERAQNSREPRELDGEAAAKSAETVSDTKLREAVESAVARQMRPLRRELQACRKTVRFHDIVGGIGYIVGIAGILFYLKSRRRSA